MSWLVFVIVTPLVAAAIIATFNAFARVIAVAGIFGSLLATVLLLQSGGDQLSIPGLPELSLRLSADNGTAAISLIVAIVASAIMVYAAGYFATHQPVRRFFVTFLSFVAAMQLFVVSSDYIILLVAWELMAVTSFLLIGHDISSRSSGRAAVRAFLTTRAGDIGLYLAIFIIITNSGSNSLSALGLLPISSALAAGILLTIAAAAKAAQIPFGGWLRDAMAGPTPVSALLHSATMVAAGVLLLVKVSPWLTGSTLLVIGLLGGATAVMAGAIATVQTDFKRLLAASTSSQLGLMFLAIGAGAPAAALLHFAAHAFMKSSLFLGAGIFQHERGSTSFKQLAGVGKARKKTFFSVTLAGLALAGIPPLAGFWSKDAIISASEQASPWLLALSLLGSLFTGIYIAVALRQLWQGSTSQHNVIVGRFRMGTALTVLVTGVVIFGVFLPLFGNLWGTVPPSSQSILLGAAVAVVGLAIGWQPIKAARIQRYLLHLSYANILERSAKSSSAVVSRATIIVEAVLEQSINAIATGSLNIAETIRQIEEAAIEGLFRFGAHLREDGHRLMGKLQTGLVHQELATSISTSFGAVVVVAVVLIILAGGIP